MYLEELLLRILEDVRREKTMLRYVAQFVMPLHLLPLVVLVLQAFRFGIEIIACVFGIMTLVAMVELTTQPVLKRMRQLLRDTARYLPDILPLKSRAPFVLSDWRWLLSGVVTTILGVALFTSALLGRFALWQQIGGAAVALALGLWSTLRPIQSRRFLDRITAQCEAELARLKALRRRPEPLRGARTDGLLEAPLLARLDAQAKPAARLSPAALALLRVEGYMLLRDNPDINQEIVRAAMRDWAEAAQLDEARHWSLPAVGGKIYLPCAVGTTLTHALAATVRRLGMDGAYSATLGTWLVRLPPARSYAVQSRLIDALAALGVFPTGAPLIHHLTVAGDLGRQSVIPALIHLLATPLLFEERPGPTQKDERPFIMRGGGVMDDLDRGRRGRGQRTDFVDGFLLIDMPDMKEVEQITAHTVNLRIKQLLAWPILALGAPEDQLTLVERQAIRRYQQLRADLEAFLTRYNLEGALSIDWIDGSWQEQWKYVRAISTLKEHEPAFLDEAQALRDDALADLEYFAVRASGQKA